LAQNLAPSYEVWAGTDFTRIEAEVSWAPGNNNADKPALLNYWTPGRVVKDWIESDIAEKEFMIDNYRSDHPKPFIKNHLVETDWL